MSIPRKHSFSWRSDLGASRDVSDSNKVGYEITLTWYERWRRWKQLPPGRESARRFWREQVISKEREEWQLAQWAEAIRWFLGWHSFCVKQGGDGSSFSQFTGTGYFVAYDSHGRVATRTDDRIGATTLAYNDRDQVVSETRSAAPGDTQPLVTSYAFDVMGRTTATTLLDDSVTTATYNQRGELISPRETQNSCFSGVFFSRIENPT